MPPPAQGYLTYGNPAEGAGPGLFPTSTDCDSFVLGESLGLEIPDDYNYTGEFLERTLAATNGTYDLDGLYLENLENAEVCEGGARLYLNTTGLATNSQLIFNLVHYGPYERDLLVYDRAGGMSQELDIWLYDDANDGLGNACDPVTLMDYKYKRDPNSISP